MSTQFTEQIEALRKLQEEIIVYADLIARDGPNLARTQQYQQYCWHVTKLMKQETPLVDELVGKVEGYTPKYVTHPCLLPRSEWKS